MQVIFKIVIYLEKSRLLVEGTLVASLFKNMQAGKDEIPEEEYKEQVKEQLETVRIFNTTSTFSKFWYTKILSEWT